MHRNLAAKIYVGYAAAVLYLCLFPWVVKPGAPGPWFVRELVGGRTGVTDVALNVAFFVPLGISGWFAFRGRWRAVAAVLASAAISFLVEGLQGWLPGRVSSVTDLLSNTSGAAMGCLAAPYLARYLPHKTPLRGEARIYLPAVALMLSFFVGQVFPFIPRYRLPHLRNVFHALGQPTDVLQVVAVPLLFAAAAYLLRLIRLPPLQGRWRFLLMAGFLLFRPLFVSAPFTGGEWAAAFLGIVAGTFLPLVALERALLVLLPLALLIEELRPFTFATHPQAFGWIPFVALFDIAPVTAIRYFAEKFFFYGATIFVLARGAVPLGAASVGVIAILAAGEAAQRYLPGRTPESTDVFLALMAWALLSSLGGISRRGEKGSRGPSSRNQSLPAW